MFELDIMNGLSERSFYLAQIMCKYIVIYLSKSDMFFLSLHNKLGLMKNVFKGLSRDEYEIKYLIEGFSGSAMQK